MKKHLFGLALMSAVFSGCTDDSYDLDNISNDFRIGVNEYLPIAHSSIQLKDLLSEYKTDYIEEGEDGKLYFVFDTLQTIEIKPIEITLDESSYEEDLMLGGFVSGLQIPASASFPFQIPIEVTFEDEEGGGRIDKISVKEGSLRFKLEATGFDVDGLLLSDLRLAGKQLFMSNPRPGQYIVVLDGEEVDFSESSNINLTCTVSVNPTYGKPLTVSGSEVKLKVQCEKTTLTYTRIEGSFTSSILQNNYTDFYINLFDDHIDNGVKIKNPELTISGRTNSGMPIDCIVKGFVGKHKTENGVSKDSVVATFGRNMETGELLDTCLIRVNAGNPDAEAFSRTFNKDFGSLEDIFSYLPDSIFVKTAFRINGSADSTYYLLDNTYLDMYINARVPLQVGNQSYLTIKDTIDGIDIYKEISDYQESDFGVETAAVIIEFDNALPLECIVNASFCTADTLSDGTVKLIPINNPSLNQSIKVDAASVVDSRRGKNIPSKSSIRIDSSMLEDIKIIKAVCFTYKIKVPRGVNEQGVYLTTDCGLSAKAYAHVKANVSNSKEK